MWAGKITGAEEAWNSSVQSGTRGVLENAKGAGGEEQHTWFAVSAAAVKAGRFHYCDGRCFRIFLNSFIFSSASRKNAPNAGVT